VSIQRGFRFRVIVAKGEEKPRVTILHDHDALEAFQRG
jgi:hypothetical protein